MMFSDQKPTLRESTKGQYLKRYHALKRNFCFQEEVADMTPEEVTANLILLKPTLAMSTWRVYKAATLHYLETHPASEDAIEQLRAESSSGLLRRSARTSGRKLKRVSVRVRNVLNAALESRARRGFRHAAGLRCVLKGTQAAGLRPDEWGGSELRRHDSSGRLVLRVRNSKHSNGRANGEFRELFIDALDLETQQAIQRAIEYCGQQSEEDAERIQKALRDELIAVKAALLALPNYARDEELRRTTLYSFRHQFIADAKYTFDDPVVVSAMVGHNSTRTAFIHYGKRVHGGSGVKVAPTPESVRAVQQIHLERYNDYLMARGRVLRPPQ